MPVNHVLCYTYLIVKLIEALQLIDQPRENMPAALQVGLACGFTPLHLQTFLHAFLLKRRPEGRVEIQTGLFGDLQGNLERFADQHFDICVIPLEWADLDGRLGWRSLGRWDPQEIDDIAATAANAVRHLVSIVHRIAARATVAISLPTLPIPPVAYRSTLEVSELDLRLERAVMPLMSLSTELKSVRILSRQKLDERSPLGLRHDIDSDLRTGFPFTKEHASLLAESLSELAWPAAPKKGLITDLDNTLWRGIVGEVGPESVGWDLSAHAQQHGLYQRMLDSLAAAGVLVAIASKNDPVVVDQALSREDLVLRADKIFPREVHWQPKSESVGRILKAWNIAADSVVFVDDSPMELAEVERLHPGITTLQFPSKDTRGVRNLLVCLRDLFGKPFVSSEDALRPASLQGTARFEADAGEAGRNIEEFMASLGAIISMDGRKEVSNTRAFELLNKTNQFNLNGKRLDWAEWTSFMADLATLMLRVSYTDKYGPLGEIAGILARRDGDVLRVSSWVMSCRAFSRRVEHATVQHLFERTCAREILLDFVATKRNGPIQTFLAEYAEQLPDGKMRIARQTFEAKCPALQLKIEVPSEELAGARVE